MTKAQRVITRWIGEYLESAERSELADAELRELGMDLGPNKTAEISRILAEFLKNLLKEVKEAEEIGKSLRVAVVEGSVKCGPGRKNNG